MRMQEAIYLRWYYACFSWVRQDSNHQPLHISYGIMVSGSGNPLHHCNSLLKALHFQLLASLAQFHSQFQDESLVALLQPFGCNNNSKQTTFAWLTLWYMQCSVWDSHYMFVKYWTCLRLAETTCFARGDICGPLEDDRQFNS